MALVAHAAPLAIRDTPHNGLGLVALIGMAILYGFLALLQREWPLLSDQWKKWAAGLTDEAVTRGVIFRDLKGATHTQPVWQIILHVVNHGTHHRGQVSGFLRSMGHVPTQLDLTYYYRNM